LFGSFLLIQLYLFAMDRAALDPEMRQPFYLFVD